MAAQSAQYSRDDCESQIKPHGCDKPETTVTEPEPSMLAFLMKPAEEMVVVQYITLKKVAKRKRQKINMKMVSQFIKVMSLSYPALGFNSIPLRTP